MADRWRGRNLPFVHRSFLPSSPALCRWNDAPAFFRAACSCPCRCECPCLAPSGCCREQMREKAHQADEDQIDRDQVVQQPWQNQNQDAEQKGDQWLNCDDVDMHEALRPGLVCPRQRTSDVPGGRKSSVAPKTP